MQCFKVYFVSVKVHYHLHVYVISLWIEYYERREGDEVAVVLIHMQNRNDHSSDLDDAVLFAELKESSRTVRRCDSVCRRRIPSSCTKQTPTSSDISEMYNHLLLIPPSCSKLDASNSVCRQDFFP